MSETTWVGIDYGSKLAGTTALAFNQNGLVQVEQSQKKQDADAWLQKLLKDLRVGKVYIDAPLSLPGIYSGLMNYRNYFYRTADIALKAMSPMFLGGLTARAMQLAAKLKESGITCHEVYPAALARNLPLNCNYKKDIQFVATCIKELDLPFQLKEQPNNWHQFDAIMAYYIGYKHQRNQGTTVGNPEEGVIMF